MIPHQYLYMTAVPVLLDGKTAAGKMAMEIYLRHELISHWFGRGRDLRLLTCSRRHTLPAPIDTMSDELLLQILRDFASENFGLLILIPCSSAAEAFVTRHLSALESYFVILPMSNHGDPLLPLIQKSC